jgi:hypothetical protein
MGFSIFVQFLARNWEIPVFFSKNLPSQGYDSQTQTLFRVDLTYLEVLVKKFTKNLELCEPTYCNLNKKNIFFPQKKTRSSNFDIKFLHEDQLQWPTWYVDFFVVHNVHKKSVPGSVLSILHSSGDIWWGPKGPQVRSEGALRSAYERGLMWATKMCMTRSTSTVHGSGAIRLFSKRRTYNTKTSLSIGQFQSEISAIRN